MNKLVDPAIFFEKYREITGEFAPKIVEQIANMSKVEAQAVRIASIKDGRCGNCRKQIPVKDSYGDIYIGDVKFCFYCGACFNKR